MKRRIHILGGSGSGTTTLGAHLALALDVPHHDTDDYYWLPTSPPYREKRPAEARLALMQQMFLDRDGWVLSGSLISWGNPLIPLFDFVVLLTLPPDVRMARLRKREAGAYGTRIEAGGDMAETHAAFMTWAEGYDDPDFESRSLHGHRAWCAALPCRHMELDSRAPVGTLVERLCKELSG